MLRRFEVHRAATVDEAVALRVQYGDDAAIYAGGTELLLAMKMGVARWPHLIDVKHVAGLGTIRLDGDAVRIGATVTHWDLERDPTVARALPALARLERNVANVRVRAAGTLAGNIAFAEPHADPPALLMALGARIVLQGRGGQRTVPLEQFVTGMYETGLGPDEIIVSIDVPVPPAGRRATYIKFQVLERPSVGGLGNVSTRCVSGFTPVAFRAGTRTAAGEPASASPPDVVPTSSATSKSRAPRVFMRGRLPRLRGGTERKNEE